MAETVTEAQLKNLLAAEPDLREETDTPYTSPFLRLLVSLERQQLSDSLITRRCKAGEIIFREGERGDVMYLIWSGRVAIVKGDLDAPSILSYKGTGEIIGEMALLENQPRSASVIALEEVHLQGMNRQRFQQLLQENPSVSFSIMEMLSARLRRASELRSNSDQSERQLQHQVDTLRTEKQRLEELSRLRQQTSELIIHDLRNPLGTIAIALRMLSLTLPEELLQANREILEVAQASCNRMQRLVDSLLEVSRMEGGEAQYLWSQVDLAALTDDVAKSTALSERRNIRIELQFPPRLPPIIADRDKIERVLINLLDNALKFSPDDGLVRVTGELENGGVRITVADNGPGIPPEEQEHIFERFVQYGDSPVRARGFGLGLVYCRLAVEGHGGKIWVESTPGAGSRFIFTLPMFPIRPAQSSSISNEVL